MGWLLACLLAMLLWRARGQVRRLRAVQLAGGDEAAGLDGGVSRLIAQQHLYHLLVLMQELERLHDAGQLDSARYRHLRAEADTLQAAILRDVAGEPESVTWQQARVRAWELLVEGQALHERPPWEPASWAPESAPPVPVVSPILPSEGAPVADVAASPPEAVEPPTVAPLPEESPDYAWEPAVPSALERALQMVAGWPAIIAPFFVQNIGWFVGGLCFVAGSVFLVTYTSGFTKTLTSFAVLALYTLLLLCGGYQIRRRHPALAVSSNALLILGMLLVPLNVTAAVRLLLIAQLIPGLLLLGVLAAVLGVGGVYVTATLVSGIMERTLQRQHPRLFLALAAVQFAVPVLAQYPAWPLLMLCHGLVLALLAYGCVAFLHPWLEAIFLERQRLAYYAAGTLLYAALVSFIHVTWGTPVAVPAGYYGPWLMLLCGLLFYADAQLKPWRQQAAALSYLSFGLYGASMVALLLALEAPLALRLTLGLGTLLYGLVTWQYATWPPLYLLWGCVSGLYYMVVLQPLAPDWHFLASLPGFAGLWAVNRWAARQRLAALALIGWRMLVLTLLSVAAWSLVQAQPGWVALLTALLVMAGAFAAPRLIPLPLWRPTSTTAVGWIYLGTGVGLAAAAYAPPVPGWPWVLQSLWGVLLWAAVWTALGLRYSRVAQAAIAARSMALVNSALLSIVVCTVAVGCLALLDWTYAGALALLLGATGGLLLWLSLGLGARALFYGVLGCWGAGLGLVKLAYFPVPGRGITTMALVLLLWGLLWWLERTPDLLAPLRQERLALRQASASGLTLLWCYPVTFDTSRSVVQTPLRQTMVLVWSLGLVVLGKRLLTVPLDWSWVSAILLGAVATALLTGSLQWAWLWPVTLILGLSAMLGAAARLGISTVVGLSVVGSLYATLVWRLGMVALAHAGVQRLAHYGRLHGHGLDLARRTYHTAWYMLVLALALPVLHAGALLPPPAYVLSLATAAAFWALAGQWYQASRPRHLAVQSSVAGLLLSASWSLQVVPLTASWSTLLHAPSLGLISVLLSLGLWGVSRRLHPAHRYARPFQVIAVQMALLAVGQVMWLVAPALGGEPSTAGFFSMGVLALAGVSLLCVNRAGRIPGLNLAGLGCGLLALLGAQSLWWHGTPVAVLWLGSAGAVDQYITLALMALGLASLTQPQTRYPDWIAQYQRSLRAAAWLTYSWASLGTVTRFGLLPFQVAPYLWVVCALLALGWLLLLTPPTPPGAELRGAGVAGLLTVGVVSLLAWADWWGLERGAWLAWAYGLWGLATLWLPSWNARWPRWAMAPRLWPWLGLCMVGSALLAWGLPWESPTRAATVRLGHYLAAVTLYLGLLLRTSAGRLWAWLAVGAFTSTALAYHTLLSWSIEPWLAPRPTVIDVATARSWLVGTVVWVNVLLLGVTLWRRHGQRLTASLRWQEHDLTPPLLWWAAIVLVPAFSYLGLQDNVGLLAAAGAIPPTASNLPTIGLGVLLCLTCLHRHRVQPTRWVMHAGVAALGGTLLSFWLSHNAWLGTPPLFLACWSTALMAATVLGTRQQWSAPLLNALAVWSSLSPLAALSLWGLWPALPLAQHLLILTALGLYAAGQGWQRQQSLWWLGALLSGVVTLHGWWFVWLPPAALFRLLPWYTLQLAALTWLVFWAEHRVTAPSLQRALAWLWPLLAGGALLAWGLHLIVVLLTLWLHQAPRWLLGAGDAGVAMLAIAAFMAVGIRQARRTRAAGWVYGVAVLGSTLWLYGRLLLVGLAPVQVWDTVALIGASYALSIVHHLVRSAPLLHVVLFLPLLAVATTPWQAASWHSGLALLTVAGLYLGLRRTTGRVMPLYLGLLTCNLGIYLWLPGLASGSQALHMYTVPAALSVLWLLHAHQAEIRPPVLHACRLAATSILYASATLDVFLRADILVFLAALGLSLGGIVLGIALRTRAFLYAGVSFLVLNVAGQLLLMFPEQRLTRAIILLGLGTLITGGMIWFNIQREALLQRLRAFRAHLETWS